MGISTTRRKYLALPGSKSKRKKKVGGAERGAGVGLGDCICEVRSLDLPFTSELFAPTVDVEKRRCD